MKEEARSRSWLAVAFGLIAAAWGFSRTQGGRKWYAQWLISAVIVVGSGALGLVVHVPVSLASAQAGSK